MRLKTPEKIPDLQRKLYLKAKKEPKFRFYLLQDKVWREDILEHAYRLVRANGGAPGIDGVTFQSIETGEGEAKFVSTLQQELKELADVDITKDPMEVGPTCHYAMGGVRVDADTTASTVAGLFAAGEVAAGLHGANRLGGNSLSDLLVFGRRAGQYAAEYASRHTGTPDIDPDEVEAPSPLPD